MHTDGYKACSCFLLELEVTTPKYRINNSRIVPNMTDCIFPTERSDEVMTYRQYRDRLRASQNPGPENDNLEAQAQSEPLMAHHKTDEGNTTTTTTLRKGKSSTTPCEGMYVPLDLTYHTGRLEMLVRSNNSPN